MRRESGTAFLKMVHTEMKTQIIERVRIHIIEQDFPVVIASLGVLFESFVRNGFGHANDCCLFYPSSSDLVMTTIRDAAKKLPLNDQYVLVFWLDGEYIYEVIG